MVSQMSSAIVRIRQANQRVVGAGFLVSDKYILTCAHVVNAALERNLEAQEQQNQGINLDFPLVESSQTFSAHVVRWIPVQLRISIPRETGTDIALLELEGSLPEGIRPVRLMMVRDLWNHTFQVFGFPEGKTEGVWTRGIIRNLQANGRVQIETFPSSAYHIQPGFSGSPIWDENLNGVVGMTVEIDFLRSENGAAFIIPTTQLLSACPELAHPYKGLHPFQEQDEKFFFGREQFTQQLIDAVKEHSLVAVIGASGSGKSSVVFAGLIPQLRSEEGWLIETFRPFDQPFRNLAKKLVALKNSEKNQIEALVDDLEQGLEHGEKKLRNQITDIIEMNNCHHLLLIVDQFEDLYTSHQKHSERQLFLDQLLEAVNQTKNFTLVLTLRADFYGYALDYRPFVDALEKNVVLRLGPMNQEELKKAITEPAKLLEVTLEPGLAERILEAGENEPGNLPLLEFALERMWANRQNNKLTHKYYQEIGGVKQALAKYAEEQYGSWSEEDQKRAQRVFIQLVRPGEGTEDTRRLATREEVGEDNWDLVTREKGLSDTRLVVTGSRLVTTKHYKPKEEETVEIVHEALIWEWQRLREWIEDSREFRTWQERLKTRMQEWKEGQGELLSKTRLKIAEEWRQKHEPELSQEEKIFINDSLKEQKKQMKNKKILRLSGGIIFIISSILLSIFGTLYYKEFSCDVGEKVGQDCFRFIITSGDSKLFVGTTNTFLTDGIKNFSNKKFDDAMKKFKQAEEAAPYDPIPSIYYNNAKALRQGNQYQLAVVVPVDAHEEVARNMLRGVAFAQNEFNNDRQGKHLLEIIIANDKNDDKIGKEIAIRLSKKNILGIIGHRSSPSSLAAIPTYQKKGIPMVSPTSGSTKLDEYNKEDNIFFRAVSSNKKTAEEFHEFTKSEHCLNNNENNKLWLLYDSDDKYSENLNFNLNQEFKNLPENFKEKIYKEDFNFFVTQKEDELQDTIKEKIGDGVNCIILLPGTETTSVAIRFVYAYQKISQQETQKIKFLSGLALHNDQTLKRDGNPFESLIVVLPRHQLDKDIKEKIDQKWEKNISWRTYTSYTATQILVDGLIEKLDNKANKKITISKKRKLLLDYLTKKKNEKNEPKSCLVYFKDIQNKYDDPPCIDLEGKANAPVPSITDKFSSLGF